MLEPPRRASLGVRVVEVVSPGPGVAHDADLLLRLVADVLGRHRHLVEGGRVGEPAVVPSREPARTGAVAADPDRISRGPSGPAQSSRITPSPSSSSCQRRSVSKLSPNSSNSLRFPPSPAPKTARPPESSSSVATWTREHLRPAARDGCHAGAEQQALRAHGDGAERDPGIGGRPVPDPREVIPEEQRLPAGLLRLLGQPTTFAGFENEPMLEATSP